MTYEEALEIVKSEFKTIKDAAHCHIIITGLTYDGCNGFCVCLYNTGEKTILSDMGETNAFFDEVEDEEWEKLCAENGVEFNHWRMEKDFEKIDDVYDFISFLDMISDKYFYLDDDEED